jgi:Fe-S cluster assembly protein SufD
MNTITKKYDEPGKWDVLVRFEKEGEEKEWVGVVDARKTGTYELRVTADHLVKRTKGKITVKAVVGAGVTINIYGLIKIRKEAQETDNFLELRVLTLDQTARITVEPELEIEANNVKASHAASLGKVDAAQILYLMSRGLSKDDASAEIVNGWLTV